MDSNYQPLSRNVREEGLYAKTYDQRKKFIEDKYTAEFEHIKDDLITSDQVDRRHKQLLKLKQEQAVETRLLQEAAYQQWPNHEDAAGYLPPQVMEFDDMHYIERRRLEGERGKNLY